MTGDLHYCSDLYQNLCDDFGISIHNLHLSIADAWVSYFLTRSKIVCKDNTKTYPSLFCKRWKSWLQTHTQSKELQGNLINGIILTCPYLDFAHVLNYKILHYCWSTVHFWTLVFTLCNKDLVSILKDWSSDYKSSFWWHNSLT